MDDTGLAVWMLRVPPGTRAQPHADEGGVGRFYVVGAGTAVLNRRALQMNSLAFVSADEAPPVIEAGPDGAQVLMLQFPRDTLEISEA